MKQALKIAALTAIMLAAAGAYAPIAWGQVTVPGVGKIIAGTNVTISPPGGTGNVTVNASAGGVSTSSPGQPTYTFWVNGPLLLTQSAGSGYSGTGTCTLTGGVLVSGSADTCTATQSGGAITFAIVGTGIYSVWPQVVLGGVTGGTGAYAQAYNDPANTTIYARQEGTGTITNGTDAAVFVTAILAANAATGGRFYFKAGLYPINSYAAETTSGWTTYYYGIGIPAGTFNNQQQWIFEGEARPEWNWGNLSNLTGPTTVSNNGVIFVSSSTAESAVSSSDMIMNFWQRPNATLAATSTNEDKFYNLACRFSGISRGNQTCLAMWTTSAIEYSNVEAGVNVSSYSLYTGSAPVAGNLGSFGMTSPYGNSGLPEMYHEVLAYGYDICYDWFEHTISDGSADAELCNYPFEFGRAGPNAPGGATGYVSHGNYVARLQDQENAHGGILGPAMTSGSRVDMPLLDIEIGAPSGYWFSNRIGGDLKETTPGTSVGNIDFYINRSNVTLPSNPPYTTLFSQGGSGFCVNGVGSCGVGSTLVGSVQVYNNSQQDAFFRANNSNLGSNWTNLSGAFDTGTIALSGNAAVPPNGSTAQAAAFWNTATFSPNQCSVVTVNGGAASYAGPIVRASAGDNAYLSTFDAGGGANAYTIQKVVSGTRTVLSTYATSVSAAPQTIELCAVGTTLSVYLNGSSSALFSTTDSSLTSGSPGIQGTGYTGPGVTMNNWQGFNSLAVTDSIGYGAPSGCGTTYAVGSTYRRLDGGSGSTWYVCENASSPAWVAM